MMYMYMVISMLPHQVFLFCEVWESKWQEKESATLFQEIQAYCIHIAMNYIT